MIRYHAYPVINANLKKPYRRLVWKTYFPGRESNASGAPPKTTTTKFPVFPHC
ncbi:unnamed protein product [Schistosoma margrebowiei]|uniref:Uncharacterized protein n=1 Tax=Schistosoma margrebowiei TaxID=48269 RepID=A0A183LQB5_9TREM|nr:unnamed protein product [Schistosoma margrebowiei]